MARTPRTPPASKKPKTEFEEMADMAKRHAVEIADSTTARAPGRGGQGQWQPGIEWISQQDAQKLMGPSTKSFYNWGQKGCPGVNPAGDVNLGLVVKWLVDAAYNAGLENSAKAARLAIDGEDISLDQLEIAEKWVDIQIKDLKFKAAKGELVPLDFVKDLLNVQVGEVSSRFRGMGAKISPELADESDTKKCQEIVDKEVDLCFERIAADDGTGQIDPEKIMNPQEIVDPAMENGTIGEAPHRRQKTKKDLKPKVLEDEPDQPEKPRRQQKRQAPKRQQPSRRKPG